MVNETLSLEILKEITRVANSTLKLEHMLSQIIDIVKSKMQIDACGIFLLDDKGETLRMEASTGFYGTNLGNVTLPLGRGITGWAAQNKQTTAWRRSSQNSHFLPVNGIHEENYQSMLSAPILKDDQCIGVINVHSQSDRDYSPLEISLLETVAHQVAGCIQNAILFSKSQMHLRELSILYDISLASQSTLKLEHGFWIILSGLTRGEAGGFNRAMLFMTNEKDQELQGVMGLGPDSPEDAHRIWASLDQRKTDVNTWVLSEAQQDEYNQSGLNIFTKTLRFPIAPGNNIFAEAVLQKKPFLVHDAWDHPLVPQELAVALGVQSFAVAPLISHEEGLGLILVDNRYNAKPIRDEDLRLLTRFAAHASGMIENTRLFNKLLATNRELLSIKEQLIETEKFSALGELSAEVAHEIKNPLVSIGGFARRLKDRLQHYSANSEKNSDIESASKYTQIIVSEVERLEALLNDILLYSKVASLNLEECSVNDLLEEVIQMFRNWTHEENIRIVVELNPHINPVYIDREKMKQVLINIFFNAVESMPQGGEIRLATYEEEYLRNQKMATIRLQDTGCGISPEVIANIFNPFFTTKDHGTGLGLSICRKIVDSHAGIIRIENNVGQGVSVYILLPLQKVCDYTSN
jgi:hypothetical protein